MVDRILDALKKCGIDTWQIVVTEEESAELFFIKKELDMQRCQKVKTADVAVFCEFTEGENHCLGTASVQVQESLTDEEICKLLQDAYYAAGFVKNKYYELYKGTKEEFVEVASTLTEKSLTEIVQGFAKALFAEDHREDVFLNSAEIFAYRYVNHILNSRGVDVAYRKSRVQGEFVVQCIDGQDVETYQNLDRKSVV